MKKAENINNVSGDGGKDIVSAAPFAVHIAVAGVCPILFHRWSCDAIEVKAQAKKGSAAKKRDDVESYVWRDENNRICLPGEYLVQSIIHAGRYKQDPRSPRKSAMDLLKAGVIALTEFAPIRGDQDTGEQAGYKKDWDFLDRRRAVVNRAGITRERPAFRKGWTAQMDLEVLLPEYIDPALLQELLELAGRCIGVGDFRPKFGRFRVTQFKVLTDLSAAAQ